MTPSNAPTSPPPTGVRAIQQARREEFRATIEMVLRTEDMTQLDAFTALNNLSHTFASYDAYRSWKHVHPIPHSPSQGNALSDEISEMFDELSGIGSDADVLASAFDDPGLHATSIRTAPDTYEDRADAERLTVDLLSAIHRDTSGDLLRKIVRHYVHSIQSS
jgi:hypothetical protein